MTKSDEKIEILSKLVIQLKTTLNDTVKQFTNDLNQVKTESNEKITQIQYFQAQEKENLELEIANLKVMLKKQEINCGTLVGDLKSKFDKDTLDLREDMLKLLKKYENKFQTQDDEIDVLKQKCEIAECSICKFESFKVHFFACSECPSTVCSNCLQTCKSCKKTRCMACLKKCINCSELLCSDCTVKCITCKTDSCSDCFENCVHCNSKECKKCLELCRKCEKNYCKNCAARCEKCDGCVSCKVCYEKDKVNERCLCGKLYCFNCEDECEVCTIPCVWENDSRVFKGFHIKSKNVLPSKCMVKLHINSKGIDTTHLGLTTDSEFKSSDMPTENFWSLVVNTGEKFSTVDYKKRGTSFTKYAESCKEGDTVYIRYYNGDVRFLINRKEYPSAFFLDKGQKLFLYCLTHDDSTNIEIKSLKVYK